MGPRFQETKGLQVLLLFAVALTCNGLITTRDLPGLDRCGKPHKLDFNTRVINGKESELGAYPWLANIGYTLSPAGGTPSWQCGGSLITDRYVITAAHCLHPSVIRNGRTRLYVTKVRLGELDLNPDADDKATPTDFDIEKITYHEDYSNLRKENDIGLIKLKGKVTYTDLIRPICLPPPEFEQSLFKGFFPAIAGWGKFEEYTPKGTRLLEAEVEIKDTDSCRENITSARGLGSAIIDHRVICAASPGTDACQGDSGGPMMLRRDVDKSDADYTGNYFLMGIVSYGYGCGREGYPGVYARVSQYMDWITNNMDK